MDANLQVALASVIGTLVISWGSVYLAHQLQMKQEKLRTEREKKQKLYSDLLGIKPVYAQLYVSRFEAMLYSDFHENSIKMKSSQGGLPDPIDHDWSEAKRFLQRSEDLTLDIAKTRRELFENIGLVKILFRSSLELSNLVQAIYKHKSPVRIPVPMFPSNSQDIGSIIIQFEPWRVDETGKLMDNVRILVEDPIQSLINHLEKELSEEC